MQNICSFQLRVKQTVLLILWSSSSSFVFLLYIYITYLLSLILYASMNILTKLGSLTSVCFISVISDLRYLRKSVFMFERL